MNAIIKGEIVRFSRSAEGFEFSVLVSQTVINNETFTLGTVVDCVVRATEKELRNHVITNGSVSVRRLLREPLRTARLLAVGDKVSVELKKNETGSWKVTDLARFPKKGQDVSEFLHCLEEKMEKH